jgi:hypothetical protein
LKRILGVVEGQDQERNRLAQDIHDGIGGALAGIKLELSQVNTSLKNNKIDQIITKMQTAFNELRLISHNLSVSSLKEKEFDLFHSFFMVIYIYLFIYLTFLLVYLFHYKKTCFLLFYFIFSGVFLVLFAFIIINVVINIIHTVSIQHCYNQI